MDMNIKLIKPSSGFTVYCKDNCNNCSVVKEYLKKNHIEFVTIQCDECLSFDRDAFVKQINSFISNHNTITTFPFVFHNNKYIGSHMDALCYIDDYIDENELF